MTVFPNIVPSTRAHTLPTKPVSNYAATTGRGRRIRHGNILTGRGLVLTFENITEAEMLAIRAHYLAHHQLRLSFNLPALVIVGETPGVLDDPDYSWIYAGPIDEDDTQCDIHSVTVPLEQVPEPASGGDGVTTGAGWRIIGRAARFGTSGRLAQLRYNRKLNATAASFTTTGQAAQVLHNKRIVGLPAAFTTTGQPAIMVYPAALSTYHLYGLAASFTMTGAAAELRHNKAIVGNAASFTFSGQVAQVKHADPHFSSVSLLLPMDGSNGSTTFTDASSNALAVTANGNAQLSTTDVKYGTACGLFDGTGDYLAIADTSLLEFGAGNYTIETWIKTTQTTQYATLFSRQNGAFLTGSVSLLINNASAGAGDVAFWVHAFGITPLMVTSGVNVIDGDYHHIAVVRNGSSHAIYVDGVSRATASTSYTIPNINLGWWIAGDQNYGRHFNGRLDDLRITQGIARYTAGFTAPTKAFLTS